MESEITLSGVECEGNYRKGTPDYFDQAHGNWLPGDPEEIEDFKVFLSSSKALPGTSERSERRIEITEFLSEEEYETLYNEMLECERGE